MKNIMAGLQQTNSEKILLSWVRQSTRNYPQVNVINFTTSWSDGLALNALIHSHRPDLFDWNSVVCQQSATQRLEHAFNIAKYQLGIEKLLDPEDVFVMEWCSLSSTDATKGSSKDNLCVEITVSLAQGYERTPSSPKPRFKSYAYTQAAYVATSDPTRSPLPSQRLEAPEDKSFGRSLMETEVNLDSYQTALEEVLSWLLSAEDTLQAQGEISNDVEEVKEQFHTHEGFMMDLTSHQGRVGNVLQLGSQLIGIGKLSEDEESEVQEQMNLLNSRWECLRVASMEKQSKFQGSLTPVAILEARANADSSKEIGQVLQEDLEQEQVRVNSLTHMVVVVDESSGDHATAALEEQLKTHGSRSVFQRRHRDRVIHLLAPKAYRKPKLPAPLQKHGVGQKKGSFLGAILQQVANLNPTDHSYTLKDYVLKALRRDWPGYGRVPPTLNGHLNPTSEQSASGLLLSPAAAASPTPLPPPSTHRPSSNPPQIVNSNSTSPSTPAGRGTQDLPVDSFSQNTMSKAHGGRPFSVSGKSPKKSKNRRKWGQIKMHDLETTEEKEEDLKREEEIAKLNNSSPDSIEGVKEAPLSLLQQLNSQII
ncbi:hypothetical protein GH733_019306 [Mirounga leonina]|nr:hypothetical protein GH733_019306 [Mirounga leonina]